MLRQVLVAGLVSGMLAAANGCAWGPHGYAWGPLGLLGPPCGPTNCEDACGASGPCASACESACGSCDSCEAGCGEAGYGFCGWQHSGPLTWLFGIFSYGYCDGGCGERYWGDWYSYPPDCCDPCDRCGNYTGAQAGYQPGAYPVDGIPMEGAAVPMQGAVPAPGGCNCGSAGHAYNSPHVAQGTRAVSAPQPAYMAQSRRPTSTGQAAYPANQAGRIVDQRMVSQTDKVIGPSATQGQTQTAAAPRPIPAR